MLRTTIVMLSMLALSAPAAQALAEEPQAAAQVATELVGGGLIAWCHYYADSLVYVCYDYQTDELCVGNGAGGTACQDLGEVPFLDEDQFADFAHCVLTHYLLIPDLPPPVCLPSQENDAA